MRIKMEEGKGKREQRIEREKHKPGKYDGRDKTRNELRKR